MFLSHPETKYMVMGIPVSCPDMKTQLKDLSMATSNGPVQE
jgi:hypothetical protein